MRTNSKVDFVALDYTPTKYGGRTKKPRVVYSTYALVSEVNTNKNILQYGGYRDAQITRLVVRTLPREPWEFVRYNDKDYRVVYMSERGRLHILTIMEQYADNGKTK